MRKKRAVLLPRNAKVMMITLNNENKNCETFTGFVTTGVGGDR